jgi:hypothetical protein
MRWERTHYNNSAYGVYDVEDKGERYQIIVWLELPAFELAEDEADDDD